jgi:hypothetical protein
MKCQDVYRSYTDIQSRSDMKDTEEDRGPAEMQIPEVDSHETQKKS